jgi:hypothetical protein
MWFMQAKQIFVCGAIAILSVTAPRINAADAEIKADVDLPKSDTRVKRDHDVTVRTDTDRELPRLRHSNKASGLLGMEVRNRENQKLGEIKDLVMENPGRVNYAVLAVGGFLGIGEKLIALPPTALHVATDGEYLVLDADKAKIQAAPGFAATAWPSPNDPEISRFWSDIKATGSPAGAEKSRRSDIDLDVDKDHHSLKGEVNVDKDHKIYTDADKKVKVDVNK